MTKLKKPNHIEMALNFSKCQHIPFYGAMMIHWSRNQRNTHRIHQSLINLECLQRKIAKDFSLYTFYCFCSLYSFYLKCISLRGEREREKEDRERGVFVKFRLKLHHLYAILSQNLYYFHNDWYIDISLFQL